MPDEILDDLSPMPFGKYKGQPMQDVPADYLVWLRDQKCQNKPVARYIKSNWKAILMDVPDYIDEMDCWDWIN